ncbi:MAG: PLP-dependent transferase, partial [Roseiarcus sp.]
MSSPRKSRDPNTLRPATQLVHGGSLRSSFDETSEALFLTQGYLYDTMEQAEARFKGDAPGYIYSRFANPTVAMFERRMALLEGAEAARATASGMAAVAAALMGQLKAGDHVVAARALFGSCL